jgi:hypothetical protein
MQQVITDLCQNKTLNLNEFLQLLKSKSVDTKELLNYKNHHTNDNILLCAARFGNLNLIKILNENKFDGFAFNINYANRDGKNALHEVIIELKWVLKMLKIMFHVFIFVFIFVYKGLSK